MKAPTRYNEFRKKVKTFNSKPPSPCISQQLTLKTTLGQRVFNQKGKQAITFCNQYDVVIPILAKYIKHHPSYKMGTDLGFEFDRKMQAVEDVPNKFVKKIKELIQNHRAKLEEIAKEADYEIKESPLAYNDRVTHNISVVSPTQLLFIELISDIDDLGVMQDLLWFAGLIDNVEHAKMKQDLQKEFVRTFYNITNTIARTSAYLKARTDIERNATKENKRLRNERNKARRQEREIGREVK